MVQNQERSKHIQAARWKDQVNGVETQKKALQGFKKTEEILQSFLVSFYPIHLVLPAG